MEALIEDFGILWNDLLQWLSNVNFFIFFAILLFTFLHQYKENNYRALPFLLFKLFTPNYLYRFIRYTIFFELIILFLSHKKKFLDQHNYLAYKYTDLVYENIILNLSQYIFLFLLVTILIYFLYRRNISKYITVESDFRNRTGKYAFLKFSLFIFTSVAIQIGFIICVSLLIRLLDSILQKSGFYPIPQNSEFPISESYHQGVYLSIFISIIIVLVLLNSIIKSFNTRYHFQDLMMYIFVLIIVGFGIYSGVYSLLNYYFNYKSFGLNSDWTNSDKLIGHFSVRITSIILLWSIAKFVYRSIFSKNFIVHIIAGILPVEPSDNYSKQLGQLTGNYPNYFDLLYFSQVAYYILNVFSAEFLISNFNLDFFASTLFLLLPIMVDDFFAIHVYHKKFNYIDKWHQIKLVGFNILLFLFSISALIRDHHYVFLSIYVLITAILYLLGNQKKI